MKIRILPMSIRKLLLGVAALAAYPAATQAAVYYQQTGTTTNWTVPSDYNSMPNGSGTAAPAMAGNDFNSNGKVIGTPSGSSVFTGNSLTISSGTFNLRNGNQKIVPTLSTTGNPLITANSASTSLIVTNFTASNGSTTTFQDIQGVITVASTQYLTFSTLTGDGDFALSSAAGVGPGGSKTFLLTVTSGINFTGDITWIGANPISLQFGNSLSLGGGLIATDTNARITLDRTVTFTYVKLNNDVLGPGTYSYTALNNTYGTIFNDGGSGSIIVIPEPATLAYLLGGAGLVLLRRRRIAAGRR